MVFQMFFNILCIKRNGCTYKTLPKIRGKVFIDATHSHKIHFGSNVVINSGFVALPLGIEAKTAFISDGGDIYIGDDVGISNSVFYSKTSICIGKNTKIGNGCKFYDTDFHSLYYIDRRLASTDKTNTISKPIKIGEDVFIGAGTIVLKGVQIGDRAIVGAGALVTKNIGENEIWAGNPAKLIRRNDR